MSTVAAPTAPATDSVARGPGALQVLGWGLAASPVIAFMEASQLVLQKRLQGDATTLWWEWTHVLPPWAAIAVCAAAVVPIVRRFPLPQKRPAKAIAVHVVAALLFPVARLGLLDAVHMLMEGGG